MSGHALKWESFDADLEAAREARAASGPALSVVREAPHPAAPPPQPAGAQEMAPPMTRAELDAMIAAARGEGRAAGFEEGVARAEADFFAEMRLLLAEIAERAGDVELIRARAQEEAAAGLERVANALLTAVAPAFARLGLADEVARVAADALRRVPQSPLRIRVAPAQEQNVREALDYAGVKAELTADPELSPITALVEWDEGVDKIDLDTCIAEAHAAIDAHFQPRKEMKANG